MAMGQEITVENVVETSRRPSRVNVFRKDSPGNLRRCYLKVEQLSGQNLNASKNKKNSAIPVLNLLGTLFPLNCFVFLKIMVSPCKTLLEKEFLIRKMSSLLKGKQENVIPFQGFLSTIFRNYDGFVINPGLYSLISF